MKDVYLYNEDISGYISKNKLPYSDQSIFSSGELNTNFDNSKYFNSEIKKAFKGQYYQNEIILEATPTDIPNNSFQILEKGYYKITLKANDFKNFSLFNSFWNDLSNANTGYCNWKTNLGDTLLFKKQSLDDPDKDKKLSWKYIGANGTEENGIYKIYNQVIIFYNNDNIELGVAELSFINTEFIQDFRQLKIKSTAEENSIFYNKIFINHNYNVTDNPDSVLNLEYNYDFINYPGVNVNLNSEFFPEYDKRDSLGKFIRKYYNIGQKIFTSCPPAGAGGLTEIYRIINPHTIIYDFLNGAHLKEVDSIPIVSYEGKDEIITTSFDKEAYIYQYKEDLGKLNSKITHKVVDILRKQNGNSSINNNSYSPLQSVGITSDIFGRHYYNEPTSGYLKIEFLGPDTLSTVISTYNKNSTNIEVLQENNIKVPRNTRIKYDFIYSKDLIQVSRGHIREDKEDYSEATLNLIKSQSYVRIYGIDGDPLNEKFVPLCEIANIIRDTDYSEHLEFTLGIENYEFFFIEETKKFKVYFNPRYLVKTELDLPEGIQEPTNHSVVSIELSYNGEEFKKISEDAGKYFEVSGDKFTEIKITYNKPQWGLVRDFSAFSSRLVELLDEGPIDVGNGEEFASWTYNTAERADIIKVRFKRDIWLDLSHQGQLYQLYITYIKENNTINQDFSLTPLRLKLGRVPYTVQKNDISLNMMFVTEGEELWLDWGFEASGMSDEENKDFAKKLYVNEILSVLPPQYTMYPINIWPYNQGFDKDTNISKTIGGVDVDFNNVASYNKEYIRNKPFQVLSFKMPPQITTIKLVVSYQHYKFNLHKDDLGILDSWVSSNEFIPGDIIKISFKLDRYHTISNKVPFLEEMEFIDDNDVSRNSIDIVKNYELFLLNLNQYNNYNYLRKSSKEECFSFYLLDKNFNKPYLLKVPDEIINLKIINERNLINFTKDLLELPANNQNRIFFNPTSKSFLEQEINYKFFLQNLIDEENVNIYLVGQDKDIDFWLTPTLFPNNRLKILGEGELSYILIENSGYYASFIAGARCGDGGDGARGLSTGESLDNAGFVVTQNDNRAYSWSNPFNISEGLVGDGSYQPHPAHSKTGLNINERNYLWGRIGGDGGPGWLGGAGGDGGSGSIMAWGIGRARTYLDFKIWHIRVHIYIGSWPNITFAGGKYAGHGGNGGNGVDTQKGGAGGYALTLSSGGSGNPGSTGVTFKNTNVHTLLSSNIFIEKGTILLLSSGFNGKKGKNGDTLYKNYQHLYNNALYSPYINQSPDGGGGGPGSLSFLFSINKNIKYNDTNRKLLYSNGFRAEEFSQESRKRDNWQAIGWLSSTSMTVDDFLSDESNFGDFFLSVQIPIINWKFIVLFQCNLSQIKNDKKNNGAPTIQYSKLKDSSPKQYWINYPALDETPPEKFLPAKDFISVGPSEFMSNENSPYAFPKDIGPLLGGEGGAHNEEAALVYEFLKGPEASLVERENNISGIIRYLSYNIGKSDPGIAFYKVNSSNYDGKPIIQTDRFLWQS